MGNRGPIKPGTELLGGYRVLGPAGEGGWSYVYKAQHPTLSRFVAIKQLKPKLVENEDALERFLREAYIVSQLNNPNVVTIYDVGRDEETGLYCIVTEFADKGSLADRLGEYHGGLPVDEVLHIAMGICDGLDAVHQKEIVHLDVKPSNVLLCDVGPGRDVPKLSDFGIAKTPGTEGTGTFKSSGPFGSFHYVSPEQLRLDEGVEVDRRSDIYSLGILIYELLTGQVPFTGEFPEVSMAHMLELPARPGELRSDIPDALEQIVLRALRKVCEERYQSAADMHEALRAVKDVAIREERRAESRDLFRQGIEHRRKEQWDAAIETLAKADLLDPDDERVQRELRSARDQQKLKRLYDQSVECLEKKDWEGVERFLLPIISYDPGYAGGAAQDLLELARRRRDLTVKYHTAMGYFRQKKWAQAIVGLEDVTAEAPDYEDAADRLADARRYKDLFDRAGQHAKLGEWERVVGIYVAISHLDLPDVDVTEELNQAVQARDEAATERQLSEWYAEGIVAQKAGHLRQARRPFEQIGGIRPDYSDVKQRLEEIDKEIKLGPLFEQASDCEVACDWDGAIATYLRILDADRHNPKAARGLARATRYAGGTPLGTVFSRFVRVRRWWDRRGSRAKTVLWALFIILALGLCGLSGRAPGIFFPPTPTPTSTPMAAVIVVTPTLTPTHTPTSTMTPSPTSTPTPTGTPTPTPIPEIAHVYSEGCQITPDRDTFLPGMPLTASCRLKGAPPGRWPEGIKLVFVDGDRMGASKSLDITRSQEPGEVVTVSIPLIAPAASGTYEGIWEVQRADGISISERIPVSVVVYVVPTPIPTPELIGVSILQCNGTFRWAWNGDLAEHEWFAVRVGRGEPHSVAWVKERSYPHTFKDPGTYVWEVAICRGEPEEEECGEDRQLAVSGRQTFEFKGCGW